MEVIQAIKSLDPSSVRVDPKCVDIGNIMNMIAKKKLILPSVLQQRERWNTLLRSRLIESILTRIPLSTFYFDEDTSGLWKVVDGVQRLLAIRDYINLVYPLECLEYLREESNGKLFSELRPYLQRRITHTQLIIQEICCACSREVKLNIFRRVRFPEYMSAQDAYKRQEYLGYIIEETECLSESL